jgi:formamidopyrimidine-DNA glycosylase
MPGLGNGMLQDNFRTARVHPGRKMNEWPERAIRDVFTAVKSVLAAVTDEGGRGTERDLFWQPGGYRTILSRNTVGTPWPICDNRIDRRCCLGGSIHYCAGCQSLWAGGGGTTKNAQEVMAGP